MTDAPSSIESPSVGFVVIGLGNRAGKYLLWLKDHPQQARLAAIVEPSSERRTKAAEEWGLPGECCFSSEDEFFSSGCEGVSAAIVASPDRCHFRQTMACIDAGLHVLLEKPVATTLEECLAVKEAADRAGVLVCVCHVLRCHPYYVALKEVIDRVGPVRKASHRIDVGPERMSHSFVRGNWSKALTSSPIILAKCSHDIDLMLWYCGGRAVSVESQGGLDKFTACNAPQGSSSRCSDCLVESGCPYSALDIYLRRGVWTDGFRDVEQEVSAGPYGRCVYRCDNDVCDYQTADVLLDNGVSLHLEMDGRTGDDRRLSVFECDSATVRADGRTIEVVGSDGESRISDFGWLSDLPYHGGADMEIVARFVSEITGSPAMDGMRLEDALESHRICFMAEESRRNK